MVTSPPRSFDLVLPCYCVYISFRYTRHPFCRNLDHAPSNTSSSIAFFPEKHVNTQAKDPRSIRVLMNALISLFKTFIPRIFLQVWCGSSGLRVVCSCPAPDPVLFPLHATQACTSFFLISVCVCVCIPRHEPEGPRHGLAPRGQKKTVQRSQAEEDGEERGHIATNRVRSG